MDAGFGCPPSIFNAMPSAVATHFGCDFVLVSCREPPHATAKSTIAAIINARRVAVFIALFIRYLPPSDARYFSLSPKNPPPAQTPVPHAPRFLGAPLAVRAVR
jgi:hypothetical protein